jgi:hypothetical protein
MSARNDPLNDLGIEVYCTRALANDVPEEYKTFWKKIGSSSGRDPNETFYAFNIHNPRLDRSATFYFNFSISKEICWILFEFLIRSYDWNKSPISEPSYKNLKYVLGDGFSEFLHAVVQHKLNSNEHIESRVFLFSAICKIPETSLKTIKLLLSEESCKEMFEDIMNHPAAKELAIFA